MCPSNRASHWATSRAEIASVNSGIETLCAISISVPVYRLLLSKGPHSIVNAFERLEYRN
jgi:hypothetical protein